jgi:hypothetical protein
MKKSGKLNFIAGFAVGAFVFGATGAFASAGKIMTYGSAGMNQPENLWVVYQIEPVGALTQAPEIGSVPAKILLPGKTDAAKADSYYPAYATYDLRGCTWYAFSRLAETTGLVVPIHYTGYASFFEDIANLNDPDIRIIRSAKDVVSGCVAFYHSTTEDDRGHSIFIEFVERDATGNPVKVYYTDGNASHNDKYTPGKDGKVHAVDFASFETMYGSYKLYGYITK